MAPRHHIIYFAILAVIIAAIISASTSTANALTLTRPAIAINRPILQIDEFIPIWNEPTAPLLRTALADDEVVNDEAQEEEETYSFDPFTDTILTQDEFQQELEDMTPPHQPIFIESELMEDDGYAINREKTYQGPALSLLVLDPEQIGSQPELLRTKFASTLIRDEKVVLGSLDRNAIVLNQARALLNSRLSTPLQLADYAVLINHDAPLNLPTIKHQLTRVVAETFAESPTAVSIASAAPAPASSSPSAIKTSISMKASAKLVKSILVPIINSFTGKSYKVDKRSVSLDSITIDDFGLSSTTSGQLSVWISANIVFSSKVKMSILGTAKIKGTFSNFKTQINGKMVLTNSKIVFNNLSSVTSLGSFNYKVSGGFVAKLIAKLATWLINFKGKMVEVMKNAGNSIKSAVSTMAGNLVITIPTTLPLQPTPTPGKDFSYAAMDTSLVELAYPSANVLTLGFAAKIIDSRTKKAYPKAELQPNHNVKPTITDSASNPTLFEAIVDESFFNNLSSTWFMTGGQRQTTFTRTTRPQWLNDLTAVVWNAMLPGIGDLYPKSDLVMNIALSKTPTLALQKGSANMKTTAMVEWFIKSDIGTQTKVCAIGIDVVLGVNVVITSSGTTTAVHLTMTKLTPTFTIDFTGIGLGKPNLNLLNGILHNIIDSVVIPQVNESMAGGIPIPASPNIKLTSPKFNIVDYAIIVSTGAEVVLTR